MATKAKSKTAPDSCRTCVRWSDVSEKVRVHDLLERAILKFEKKIAEKDYEPTVAEYLKLIQMEREVGFEDDEPKEIKVTWVLPNSTSDCEK